MEKLNHKRTFGKIVVENYDYRPLLSETEEYPVHVGYGLVIRRKRIHRFKGRGEASYLKIDGKIVGYGKYTRINRPRQRFDFEMSIYHAYHDMLNTIDWRTYNKYKKSINQIRDLVKN